MLRKGNLFEAGFTLWSGCFIDSESSKEISLDKKYKLGLYPVLGNSLDLMYPDLKKN